MELEQTVVELNGRRIDVSRIGNERVAQALGEMSCTAACGCKLKGGYNEHHRDSGYSDHHDYSVYSAYLDKGTYSAYSDRGDGHFREGPLRE